VSNYKVQCMYIRKRVCRDIFYNLSYCKVSCACSRTRSPRLLPLRVGGFYPVRDIILHHYHHRHHHRDGSHLDILRLSLTHYPTYAHWRHSVSQSVSRSVGPCDSFGFMLGFPVRAPFWIAHELSGDPVESCVYLQRDKWFLIWHSNWEID